MAAGEPQPAAELPRSADLAISPGPVCSGTSLDAVQRLVPRNANGPYFPRSASRKYGP